MSAITGIGDSTTIRSSALTSSSRGTAQRTRSPPASAIASICFIVASKSAVSVFVIDWTATGAPPPIFTPPTSICFLEAITRPRSVARRHAAAPTGGEAVLPLSRGSDSEFRSEHRATEPKVSDDENVDLRGEDRYGSRFAWVTHSSIVRRATFGQHGSDYALDQVGRLEERSDCPAAEHGGDDHELPVPAVQRREGRDGEHGGGYIHHARVEHVDCDCGDQPDHGCRDSEQEWAHARVLGDRHQPAVKEDREYERGQEDPERHGQPAVQSARDVADEGREDDERCGEDAAHRETIHELGVGKPVLALHRGVVEVGDDGERSAEGHEACLQALPENLGRQRERKRSGRNGEECDWREGKGVSLLGPPSPACPKLVDDASPEKDEREVRRREDGQGERCRGDESERNVRDKGAAEAY